MKKQKKYLLASLPTEKGVKRVRYFQLLAYISLTGNIAFIICIILLIRQLLSK